MMTTLKVLIDTRIRNTSAILAATSWVETEQKPLPRGVHHEAASLRKYVEALNQADAATHIQNDLDSGIEVSAFFARALADDESFSTRLNDFSAKANLDSYWKEHDAVWQESAEAVQKHIKDVDFTSFLREVFGDAPGELIIHPNLAYPTTHSFGIKVGDRAYSIIVPRKAVGESAPWPFADDREHILRLVIHDFCQAMLDNVIAQNPQVVTATASKAKDLILPDELRAIHPSWALQLAELFNYGATVVFMNRIIPGSGDAFALYERRTKHILIMPTIIEAVTQYLERKAKGNATPLAEYLPQFINLL